MASTGGQSRPTASLLACAPRAAELRSRPLDLPTAPGALLGLLASEPGAAMLESTAYHPEFGRYSIFACRPLEVITLREGVLRDDRGRVLARDDEAVWAALERAFACVELTDSSAATAAPDLPPAADSPRSSLETQAGRAQSYAPGWIGYVGYEMGRHVERLPGRAVRDTSLPDLRLAFYDALLIYDALEHAWQLASLRFAGTAANVPASAGRGERALLAIAARARNMPAEERPAAAEAADAAERPAPADVSGNFSAAQYCAAVRRCVDYIAAGDIFQVNLSQRLEVARCPRPLDVYRALRRRNPAWYAAYLSFRCRGKPCAVVSSSPELFLRVQRKESPSFVDTTESPSFDPTEPPRAAADARHGAPLAGADAEKAASPHFSVPFLGEKAASPPFSVPFSVPVRNPQSAIRNPQSVLTRPIKGTRPRTGDAAADAAAAAELWASPKDNAELAMIIDLLRNDLGRVCRFGSLRVLEPRRLETHPTVYHLVGTVAGELRPEIGPAGLLRATLPGGSITGAPKVRAMEIIDEMEHVARGVYTGCIGIVGVNGRSEWNIAIRTIVCDGGRALVQAGGAVVADSDPAAEHRETLDKARALLEAIEAAKRGRRRSGEEIAGMEGTKDGKANQRGKETVE